MTESQSPIRFIRLVAPEWSFLANIDEYRPHFFKDSALKNPKGVMELLGKPAPIKNGALEIAWPSLSPVSAAARDQQEEAMEEVSALIKHYREKTFTELFLIRRLIVESGVWERPPQSGNTDGATDNSEEKEKAKATTNAENDKCLRALMALFIVTDAIAHNSISRDHPFTEEFVVFYRQLLQNDCAMFVENCAQCFRDAGMVLVDESQDGPQERDSDTAQQAFRKALMDLSEKWDGPGNIQAEEFFTVFFQAPLGLEPDFFPESFSTEPQAEEEWGQPERPEDELRPEHLDLPLISLRKELLKDPAQLDAFFGPHGQEALSEADIPDLFPNASSTGMHSVQEWQNALPLVKNLKSLLDRRGIDDIIALAYQAEEKAESGKNWLAFLLIADYIQKRFFESPKSPVTAHNPYSYYFVRRLKAMPPEIAKAADGGMVLIDRFIQEATQHIGALLGKPPAPKTSVPASRFKKRGRGSR